MTKPLVEGFCEPEFSKLKDIFVKSIQSGFDDGAGFSLEVEGKEVEVLTDKLYHESFYLDLRNSF